MIAGELVVSHHNNGKARVQSDTGMRLNCDGFYSRNRALSGDRVYVKITEPSSVDSHIEAIEVEPNSGPVFDDTRMSDYVGEKSCKVVGIQKRSGQRYVSRTKTGEALVQPRDVRFPAMRPDPPLNVSETSCLALVHLKDWADTEQYPDCSLIRLLGQEGSFDAEDDSSLEMNGLISDSYPSEVEDELRGMFPNSSTVVNTELKHRVDLRISERVFSIDPPKAKDLDDAISIRELGQNLYRIGVHVADVSHFVIPTSRVDREAALRATSVYLARKVYPMLPAFLSENLCSLLPGEDRLAVSVFFTLNGDTGVVEGVPSIERTVIRSLAKLSYDQVDEALSGTASIEISTNILSDIKLLMSVTGRLRTNRIAEGSVTIDDRNGQSEITFEFLPNIDFPIAVQGSSSRSGGHDSHTLIEELMVLTNRMVAEKLCDQSAVSVPVLRRHLESEAAVLQAAREFLYKAGIVGIETNERSVTEVMHLAKAQLSPAMFSAFTHSILGEFNRAEYVTGGTRRDDSKAPAVAHWGVGAKRYMHFTSPIRRYADLIVHRKLLSNAGDEDVRDQIQRCNMNSRAAKDAEKDNKLFYFTTLVKSFGNGGMYMEAVVKDLIAPDAEKGIKGSVSFFLPILAETRSQSLESLGLTFIDLEKFHDGSLKCIKARDLNGVEIVISALQLMVLRAYVKNPSVSIPKLHLRIDGIPEPPSTRRVN